MAAQMAMSLHKADSVLPAARVLDAKSEQASGESSSGGGSLASQAALSSPPVSSQAVLLWWTEFLEPVAAKPKEERWFGLVLPRRGQWTGRWRRRLLSLHSPLRLPSQRPWWSR